MNQQKVQLIVSPLPPSMSVFIFVADCSEHGRSFRGREKGTTPAVLKWPASCCPRVRSGQHKAMLDRCRGWHHKDSLLHLGSKHSLSKQIHWLCQFLSQIHAVNCISAILIHHLPVSLPTRGNSSCQRTNNIYSRGGVIWFFPYIFGCSRINTDHPLSYSTLRCC